MKEPRQVIISHLLSEKFSVLREKQNAYVFEVAKDANKIEIKNAVENLFNVHVDSVKVQVMRGKMKRLGRFVGKRPNWKKAIVNLKEGETITQLDAI
ncbi:MAG TPA: 50S ribosomal protein L23 [candidate division Zixibacteria bacterium]|nr:50S ribosomal protein L23 [candidate division Zixibacteria bacterium]